MKFLLFSCPNEFTTENSKKEEILKDTFFLAEFTLRELVVEKELTLNSYGREKIRFKIINMKICYILLDPPWTNSVILTRKDFEKNVKA